MPSIEGPTRSPISEDTPNARNSRDRSPGTDSNSRFLPRPRSGSLTRRPLSISPPPFQILDSEEGAEGQPILSSALTNLPTITGYHTAHVENISATIPDPGESVEVDQSDVDEDGDRDNSLPEAQLLEKLKALEREAETLKRIISEKQEQRINQVERTAA
jgi:hypothetical protein